jgi:hypothetical protein
MEALRLHLERARDREGGSKTAWCVNYWRGSARARGGGGGSQRSKIRPHAAEIYKNGKNTGGFVLILAYKLSKTPFFPQKFLTIYTPETCFEDYINLKFFIT